MVFINLRDEVKTENVGKGTVPDLRTERSGAVESGLSLNAAWRTRGDVMEINKFLELAKKLDSKKKGKKEELEKFKKLFERFHNLNRAYLDNVDFEKAEESVPAMAEAIAGTIQYLEGEITRLRNKRMKMPFENVELGEMQKIQKKNEMLIKEFLAEFQK